MNKVNCYCKFIVGLCSALKYKITELPLQALVYLALPDDLKGIYYVFNPNNYLYSKEVDYVETLIKNTPHTLNMFECENINDDVLKTELQDFQRRSKIVIGFLFENGLFNHIEMVNVFSCIYYFYHKALTNNCKFLIELSIKLDKRFIYDLIV